MDICTEEDQGHAREKNYERVKIYFQYALEEKSQNVKTNFKKYSQC